MVMVLLFGDGSAFVVRWCCIDIVSMWHWYYYWYYYYYYYLPILVLVLAGGWLPRVGTADGPACIFLFENRGGRSTRSFLQFHDNCVIGEDFKMNSWSSCVSNKPFVGVWGHWWCYFMGFFLVSDPIQISAKFFFMMNMVSWTGNPGLRYPGLRYSEDSHGWGIQKTTRVEVSRGEQKTPRSWVRYSGKSRVEVFRRLVVRSKLANLAWRTKACLLWLLIWRPVTLWKWNSN